MPEMRTNEFGPARANPTATSGAKMHERIAGRHERTRAAVPVVPSAAASAVGDGHRWMVAPGLQAEPKAAERTRRREGSAERGACPSAERDAPVRPPSRQARVAPAILP